ncbi:FxsA family protein [Mycobacterium decipiens]|uniref:Membrane protein FxsA n=1 Tax=Mycobacterium decipiens TaxID=1430326 RepID=A0A1X2LS48_9MYCO|nr:FxsA family protein [Mycobacterium decipiens]OSC39564.1 membrane protein FxsA [Mycobacterium decipiens]
MSRLLLIYAVVELAVVFALAATIGFGWTLLVLLATFVLGVGLLAPLGGLQLGRQLMQLRSGLTEPRSALSDGALVTIASVLVLVPGLVTTALGLLLLVPPIRAVAGPGLTAVAVRGFLRRVPLTAEAAAGVAGAFNLGDRGADPDFIDGEVIDVQEWDVESPTLGPGPVGDEPPGSS